MELKEVNAGGWTITPDEQRKNIEYCQRYGHANVYFQRWFDQDDYCVILIHDMYDERHPHEDYSPGHSICD